MIIHFDIETVSVFSESERKMEYFQDLKEKYGDKLNFMPEFNKILTITNGMNTQEGIITRNLQGNEEDQIKTFFKSTQGHIICGFNIKGFDIPFIIKRALKYQIDIPECLKFHGKKPWEMENILDLNEVYKCGSFGSFSNLDLVCNFLGITSLKDEGIDGSQVQAFYDLGEANEILEYCCRDVEATIKVYNYFKEYNLI